MAWLNKNNVLTTLNTVIINFNFTGCEYDAEPHPTKVSKKVRSKLQSGETHSNFLNTELKEFFTNDLMDEGEKNPIVHSFPEGEVSFVFGLIQGRKSSVQVFFNTECNCAIVQDSIPNKEFNLTLLKPGPIDIDVATGVKVKASREWGMMFPLLDGSYQAIRSLAVPKVTADMPIIGLRSLVAEIKKRYSSHPDITNLNNLNIPQVLGGEIYAIIGIQYASTYSELVFS